MTHKNLKSDYKKESVHAQKFKKCSQKIKKVCTKKSSKSVYKNKKNVCTHKSLKSA